VTYSYTKLYRSLTSSTVWVGQPAHVKLSWIVLLSEADEVGRVTTPVPVLAKLAEVTVAEFEEALAIFLAPDKYSRSKEYDGRRIEPLDDDEEFGGFRILNHEKYREKRDLDKRREQNREAQARWRERNGRKPRSLTNADARAESAEVSHKKPIPSASTSEVSSPTCSVDPRPDRSPAREQTEPAALALEPYEREKRRGRKPSADAVRLLPEGWAPNDGHREMAYRLGLILDDQAELFRDRNKSKGAKYADWDAAFRTWLRNARKFDDAAGIPRATVNRYTHEEHLALIERDLAKRRAELKPAPPEVREAIQNGTYDFGAAMRKLAEQKIHRSVRTGRERDG
jgi:hypothetical protein